MTLTDSIIKMCKENFSKENNWYNWREINETNLPEGIKLPNGNQYVKNIELKKALHANWKSETNSKRRGDLIEYYIKTWGGIKGNNTETMEEYKTRSAEELIRKGTKGVASWSKAIVVHDPNKYAIFDARVSISLNCLQIIDTVEDKKLYPLLPSQNKIITNANKRFKIIAKMQKWRVCDEATFYMQYLDILKEAAKKLNTNISTIEMLLFAKAEQLIDIALKNEDYI